MRENFIYDKTIKKADKKYYQYFYPIHCSIKEELNKTLKELKEILSELKMDDQIIYQDELPMDLDNTILLVSDILNTCFPENFYEYFKQLNLYDRIKYYDMDSAYLEEQYDQGNGSCNKIDLPVVKSEIYIPLQNEFYDTCSIIHELSHLMIGGLNEYFALGYLGEVIPIFSEFVVFNYALEHFPSHPTIFSSIYGRYEELLETEFLLETNPDYVDSFEYFDRTKYMLSLLIASKFYQDYLINPEHAMNQIMEFSRLLGLKSFNQLMKYIGVNIRYYDDSLHGDGMESLLTSFTFVMEYLNQQYKKVESQYQKSR